MTDVDGELSDILEMAALPEEYNAASILAERHGMPLDFFLGHVMRGTVGSQHRHPSALVGEASKRTR